MKSWLEIIIFDAAEGLIMIGVPPDLISSTIKEVWNMISHLAVASCLLGLLMLLMAVLSLFGTCYNNKSLLLLYASMTAGAVLVHFIVVSTYARDKILFTGYIEELLEEKFHKYVSLENGAESDILAAVVMQENDCCGYQGRSEIFWANSHFSHRDSTTLYEFP
ncbi:hypothetical protein CSKR_101273, partial [Clonorchis sinensis]